MPAGARSEGVSFWAAPGQASGSARAQRSINAVMRLWDGGLRPWLASTQNCGMPPSALTVGDPLRCLRGVGGRCRPGPCVRVVDSARRLGP
jgi:hypothetical protein